MELIEKAIAEIDHDKLMMALVDFPLRTITIPLH